MSKNTAPEIFDIPFFGLKNVESISNKVNITKNEKILFEMINEPFIKVQFDKNCAYPTSINKMNVKEINNAFFIFPVIDYSYCSLLTAH
jgi:hypothetical protein